MTASVPSPPTLSDRLFAIFQQLTPQHWASHVIYRLMRKRSHWLRTNSIRTFLRLYPLNMSEAIQSDPFAYESFNAFFTRALRPDARHIVVEEDAIASPVDGTVSQCGTIEGDVLIQAKGHGYSLLALLGGDAALAARYRNGHFACIYLAPYNYHRIHMPLNGTVAGTTYVPGALFSVNAATARTVPGLFARNERVICDFRSTQANFAMVLVGALFVGSIETVWAGEINPPPRRLGSAMPIPLGHGTTLRKGAEAGRFNMGSTVVLLFEPGAMHWDAVMTSGATLRMGQRIGTLGPALIDHHIDIEA